MSTPIITSTGDAFVPRRRRLPDERKAVTHKFQIGLCEGYITVGLYEDGQPGEIFITLSKDVAQNAGLVDSFATAISLGLQYGVPLKVLVNKFAHARYEPSGPTQNPNIPHAKSVVDYIFRWLALKFLTPEERQSVGLYQEPGQPAQTMPTYNAIQGMPNNQSFLSRIESQGS